MGVFLISPSDDLYFTTEETSLQNRKLVSGRVSV